MSGGSDSLALLLLAAAAFDDVAAITVDHGLRPESAHEAEFVGQVCRDLGVDHTIRTLAPLGPGNVSDAARKARYDAIALWAAERGIPFVMTGHHADDQLETMIMRLNRGSGLGGLAGIRRRRGKLVRPLLGWRHAELAVIVAAAGLTAVDDPSNRDERYDRARLRRVLADADWLDPVAATHSAHALDEAEAALAWTARRYCGERAAAIDGGGIALRIMTGLPVELQRRVFLICLTRIVPTARPRGGAVGRALAALRGGRTVTLSGVKCAAAAREWRFTAAPANRPTRPAEG